MASKRATRCGRSSVPGWLTRPGQTRTASFAALDRSVLRPLAFPEADRLAYITVEDATQRFRGTPPAAAVQRWRGVPIVAAIGGYRPTTAVYSATGVPELLPAGQMTANLPTLLQVQIGMPGCSGKPRRNGGIDSAIND
jgi:hypothetical protein